MWRLPYFLIMAYRRFLSPLLPATCRFYPTCSAYGAEALRRYGLFKGGWLLTKRLARCHPWHPGGIDPVPGSFTAACSHTGCDSQVTTSSSLGDTAHE